MGYGIYNAVAHILWKIVWNKLFWLCIYSIIIQEKEFDKGLYTYKKKDKLMTIAVDENVFSKMEVKTINRNVWC